MNFFDFKCVVVCQQVWNALNGYYTSAAAAAAAVPAGSSAAEDSGSKSLVVSSHSPSYTKLMIHDICKRL